MKKALLFCIALLLAFTISATAEPLTDYRLGHFQVGGGWWGGTTDLAMPTATSANSLNYAQAHVGNFTADATIGLSHGFALRYGYTDLSNNYSIHGGGNKQINLNAQEVDLLFKIGSSLGGLVNDAVNLATGKPLKWTAEPEGRNIYALFVGAGQVFGDMPEDPSANTPHNATGYMVGIMNSSQYADNFWSFGRLSLTANASVFVEAGLAYQVLPGASVSIAYKNYNLAATTTNSNNDSSFMYRSGFEYGLNYQF